MKFKNYLNESSKYKVGDKITTDLPKNELLHGREGKVTKISSMFITVDFGNGDVYGISPSRIKDGVIIK